MGNNHIESGASGFSDSYWSENYSKLDEMDGVGNADAHASTLKNTFDLELVDISSIIDYGMGPGFLFQAILKKFIPFKAIGIEPSAYAYKMVQKRDISPVESTKLKIMKLDILNFCLKNKNLKRFDLGICTSVFQYLDEAEIDTVLPIMAKHIKYLYFSVPTNKELKRQREELDFNDRYAYKRSKVWYQKKIKKYFTFVSLRLLESKAHFNEDTTFFTDLLFRF